MAQLGLLEVTLGKSQKLKVSSIKNKNSFTLHDDLWNVLGLKVIGIAGSEEKGQFLTKELGFDHFINYKTQDISQALQEIAPEGVDLYFDNVRRSHAKKPA